MGKRSTFTRRPQDMYETPLAGAVPLSGFLPSDLAYWEPCAGRGALIDGLSNGGSACALATEKHPGCAALEPIYRADCMTVRDGDLPSDIQAIITNPPWTRAILHPMIDLFSSLRPTWLLFDADWKHTKQAVPLVDRCTDIVSIGRLKWIPGSKHTGKDNCAWYRFDASHAGGPHFHPQQIVEVA